MSDNKALIYLLVGGAVLLVGGGVIYAMTRKKDDDNDSGAKYDPYMLMQLQQQLGAKMGGDTGASDSTQTDKKEQEKDPDERVIEISEIEPVLLSVKTALNSLISSIRFKVNKNKCPKCKAKPKNARCRKCYGYIVQNEAQKLRRKIDNLLAKSKIKCRSLKARLREMERIRKKIEEAVYLTEQYKGSKKKKVAQMVSTFRESGLEQSPFIALARELCE